MFSIVFGFLYVVHQMPTNFKKLGYCYIIDLWFIISKELYVYLKNTLLVGNGYCAELLLPRRQNLFIPYGVQ